VGDRAAEPGPQRWVAQAAPEQPRGAVPDPALGQGDAPGGRVAPGPPPDGPPPAAGDAGAGEEGQDGEDEAFQRHLHEGIKALQEGRLNDATSEAGEARDLRPRDPDLAQLFRDIRGARTEIERGLLGAGRIAVPRGPALLRLVDRGEDQEPPGAITVRGR